MQTTTAAPPPGASTASTGTGASQCPDCGAAFVCGMGAGSPTCWCMALPPTMAVPGQETDTDTDTDTAGGSGADAASARCWCPACLQHRIASQGHPP